MSGVNYARLKQTLVAAGFDVSPGPYFHARDFGQYENYLIQTPFRPGNGGVTVNPAAIAYGTAYPDTLPAPVAAQISTGVTLANVLLWPEALQPNSSYLYAGLHNPGSNFSASNGNNVQVGISVRYKNDGDIPKSSDGTYNLPRLSANNQQPWSFAFSVATAEGVALDDYDVELSLSLDTTGAATPVLKYTLDGNVLVSDPAGSNITDNEGVDNQVVQNIEQYSFAFLKNLLLPESMRTETVPFGKYTLTLTATGKEGPQAGDKASVTVKANIS